MSNFLAWENLPGQGAARLALRGLLMARFAFNKALRYDGLSSHDKQKPEPATRGRARLLSIFGARLVESVGALISQVKCPYDHKFSVALSRCQLFPDGGRLRVACRQTRMEKPI